MGKPLCSLPCNDTAASREPIEAFLQRGRQFVHIRSVMANGQYVE